MRTGTNTPAGELVWLCRDSDAELGYRSLALDATPTTCTAAATAGPSAEQLQAARRAAELREALRRCGTARWALLAATFEPRSVPPDVAARWGQAANAVAIVERAIGRSVDRELGREVEAAVTSALAAFAAVRRQQIEERRDELRHARTAQQARRLALLATTRTNHRATARETKAAELAAWLREVGLVDPTYDGAEVAA